MKRTSFNLTPAAIVYIYVAVSFVWISFSDSVVDFLVDDPTRLTQIQTIKGWFFVSVTGVLLYFLITRYRDKMAQKEKQIKNLNENLERKVAKRTRELELVNSELEAFSFSVSHDLRAPLRAIDGFSAALLDSHTQKLDSQAQDYLTKIRNATIKMGDLIDDYLALSRITRTNINIVETDLSELSNQILNGFIIGDPNRSVKIQIEPNLKVYGDPGLLKILLTNLLENSWKFTKNEPQAIIEVFKNADTEEICFRDNGVGFDMKKVDEIFQPYRRLHSANEFEGTGIGLASVKRIINRHSGEIRAESDGFKSTCFCFKLPDYPNDMQNAE